MSSLRMASSSSPNFKAQSKLRMSPAKSVAGRGGLSSATRLFHGDSAAHLPAE